MTTKTKIHLKAPLHRPHQITGFFAVFQNIPVQTIFTIDCETANSLLTLYVTEG